MTGHITQMKGSGRLKTTLLWLVEGLLVFALVMSFSAVKAHAYTVKTLPADNPKYIPRAAALLNTGFSNATVSWSSGVAHQVKSFTDGYYQVFSLKRPTSTTKTTTYASPCCIVYSNAGYIGIRSVDVVLNIDEISVGPRYSSSAVNEDETYFGFMYMRSNATVFGIGSNDLKLCYRSQVNIKTSIDVRWSDSGETVEHPFVMALSDIDTPETGNSLYGKVFEGWQGHSGFDSTFYVFPSCTLNNSNGIFKAADTANQGSYDSWYRGGIIAPTIKGSCSSTFYTACCSTSLSLYSPFSLLQEPVKSLSGSKGPFGEGDTVSYEIRQAMGTMLQDTYASYPSLKLEDEFADANSMGMSFSGSRVYYEDDSGQRSLDEHASITEESKGLITMSLDETALRDARLYTGGDVVWRLDFTIEPVSEARKTVINSTRSFIGASQLIGNEVSAVLEGKPRIEVTKRIRAKDVLWVHGEPSFVFCAQADDGTTHWKLISFDKGMAADEDGFLEAGCVFAGLEKRSYVVSELPTIRYEQGSCSGTGEVTGNEITIDLAQVIHGSALFENEKRYNSGLSDAHSRVNEFPR